MNINIYLSTADLAICFIGILAILILKRWTKKTITKDVIKASKQN